MPYESSNLNDTSGAEFNATATLQTWSQVKTFYGYSPVSVGHDDTGSSVFFPYTAFHEIDEIAAVGERHATIPIAYCTNVRVEPFSSNDTVNLRAIESWARPGVRCEISNDTYQQSEVTNFAESSDERTDGKVLTEIHYKPTSGGAPSVKLAVPFVADFRVPKILFGIRVTQYEVMADGDGNEFTPEQVIQFAGAFWNEDPFAGFQAGELLFVGKNSTSLNGTAIYRCTYQFLYNPNSRGGWHHFYAVWVDARGMKPQDIKPIDPASITSSDPNIDGSNPDYNGNAAYKVLDSNNFNSTLGAKILPPFHPAGS